MRQPQVSLNNERACRRRGMPGCRADHGDSCKILLELRHTSRSSGATARAPEEHLEAFGSSSSVSLTALQLRHSLSSSLHPSLLSRSQRSSWHCIADRRTAEAATPHKALALAHHPSLPSPPFAFLSRSAQHIASRGPASFSLSAPLYHISPWPMGYGRLCCSWLAAVSPPVAASAAAASLSPPTFSFFSSPLGHCRAGARWLAPPHGRARPVCDPGRVALLRCNSR